MKFTRSHRIIALALGTVIIALILNCHKDLIQYSNIRALLSANLGVRCIPHRINDIDKLQAILGNGFRSAEIDVWFYANENDSGFQVGHDGSGPNEIRLDQFLKIMQPYKLKKLWLDVKNLTVENLDAALRELIRLDKTYGLREIAIVESGITSNSFEKFRAAGFHTSYYLPTEHIANMLREGNRVALTEVAKDITAQISNQSVSAVSFDLALYSFVKEYLEPSIPNTVGYHTWGSFKLWEWRAVSRMKEHAVFRDARVETILVRYWGSGCFSWLL